jgi:hypothetical protein
MKRYLKPRQQSNFPRYYPPYPVPYAEYDVDNVYGSVNVLLEAMDSEDVINGLMDRSGSCMGCGSHNTVHRGSCTLCGTPSMRGSFGREERKARREKRKERRSSRKEKRQDRRSSRKEKRQDRRSSRRANEFQMTTGPSSNPIVQVSKSEAQQIIDNASTLLNNMPPRNIDSFDQQIKLEGMALAPIASGMAPVQVAARDDEAASTMGLATKALIATAVIGGSILAFRTLDIGDLL